MFKPDPLANTKMSTTNTPAKPKIHTSDLPRSLSPSSDKPSKNLSSSLHNNLTSALLTGASVPMIEKALTEELSKVGWTMTLRAHVQNLVRSGECSNYSEVMTRVLGDIKVGEGGAKEKNGDEGDDGKASGLAVPENVVREAVKVIRKELEKVATLVADD
jgi:hypothetical protein